MLKNKLNRYGFLILLITSFILHACQPAVVEETPLPSTPTRPESTAQEVTPEPTAQASPSPQPTIALDYRTLKGLTVTLTHPFIEKEALFDQLVRDFNLSNSWGIHISSNAESGYQAVAQKLNSGDLESDMVIAMGVDLAAAPHADTWLPLDFFSKDLEYGIDALYGTDSLYIQTQVQETPLFNLPLAYNPALLYYNRAWASELGYPEMPATLEDLLLVAKAAMNFNALDQSYLNNGTGGLWLSRSSLSALSWYTAFGGQLGDPENGFLPDETSLLSSFQTLKDAFVADQTWIGVESVAYRYLSERYAVAYEGSLSDLEYQSAYQGKGAFQDDWTTMPYLNSQGSAQTVLEPLSFAIKDGDEKNELAAWLFGRWLLEPAQQARLVAIHGFWPSTGDPSLVAPEFAQQNPAWVAAYEAAPGFVVVPQVPSWAQTQLIFQDAYQRVYNLDAQYFPSILEVFKETLRINLEQRP